MSRSRSFRGRHFRMTSKLVFVAISVVLRECSAAASPSSSATETVSPSVSPSPSFTPLPCPSSGCVPWLGPSVSNGTCNFNSDQCARGQCNLAVQIPFAYFNTSLSADYVNLVATIDGLTWWHTSNGADIGSRAKNIITLSDGCFGSGNEWLTIAVCLTKASDFFPENTPKFNCLATSNCVLEPQGICIPPPVCVNVPVCVVCCQMHALQFICLPGLLLDVQGLANGTNPPPVPPYCDPVTKQFNINYASNHISIWYASQSVVYLMRHDACIVLQWLHINREMGDHRRSHFRADPHRCWVHTSSLRK